MVMCVKNPTPRAALPAADDERPGYGDGGPVFVPSRRLSRLARSLLASLEEGGSVAVLDEPGTRVR